MKRYIQFLVLAAILLGIACTVQEYYFSQETQKDEYAFFHQSTDNSKQPWELILVNEQNCLPENFGIELHETKFGEKVDERIYPYLEEMFLDAEKDGHSPEITSGYRSKEKQQQLFDDRVKEYRSAGYSKKEAKQMTLKQVAKPGYSEHETGLAVDINSTGGNSWDLYGWLSNNSYKYGFILRYPDGKEDITGINYEPWHFRFVGKEAAEYIHENSITLEEYILKQ